MVSAAFCHVGLTLNVQVSYDGRRGSEANPHALGRRRRSEANNDLLVNAGGVRFSALKTALLNASRWFCIVMPGVFPEKRLLCIGLSASP